MLGSVPRRTNKGDYGVEENCGYSGMLSRTITVMDQILGSESNMNLMKRLGSPARSVRDMAQNYANTPGRNSTVNMIGWLSLVMLAAASTSSLPA